MATFMVAVQAATAIGTGYVGYLHAAHIKTMLNSPTFKPYKDKLDFRRSDVMNEDQFCKLSGGVMGGLAGFSSGRGAGL